MALSALHRAVRAASPCRWSWPFRRACRWAACTGWTSSRATCWTRGHRGHPARHDPQPGALPARHPRRGDPFRNDRWDYMYYLKPGKSRRTTQRWIIVWFDGEHRAGSEPDVPIGPATSKRLNSAVDRFCTLHESVDEPVAGRVRTRAQQQSRAVLANSEPHPQIDAAAFLGPGARSATRRAGSGRDPSTSSMVRRRGGSSRLRVVKLRRERSLRQRQAGHQARRVPRQDRTAGATGHELRVRLEVRHQREHGVRGIRHDGAAMDFAHRNVTWLSSAR